MFALDFYTAARVIQRKNVLAKVQAASRCDHQAWTVELAFWVEQAFQACIQNDERGWAFSP